MCCRASMKLLCSALGPVSTCLPAQPCLLPFFLACACLCVGGASASIDFVVNRLLCQLNGAIVCVLFFFRERTMGRCSAEAARKRDHRAHPTSSLVHRSNASGHGGSKLPNFFCACCGATLLVPPCPLNMRIVGGYPRFGWGLVSRAILSCNENKTNSPLPVSCAFGLAR